MGAPSADDTSLASRVSDLTAQLKEHVFQGRIFDARVTALKLKSMRNEVSDAAARTKIDSDSVKDGDRYLELHLMSLMHLNWTMTIHKILYIKTNNVSNITTIPSPTNIHLPNLSLLSTTSTSSWFYQTIL